jgi:UDP-N-acetylmuramate--alanine ligase
MSAVARLVAAKGVDVSGDDRAESLYFQALRDAGMDVRVVEDASRVDGADAVVVSSAIRDTNPELARARELAIKVLHRSEALVWALDGLSLVAVAGSHGKTTTSAMTAKALHGSGIDASFAVGARVFGVEGAVAGGYAGDSEIAVVEADESDGSFLRYRPHVGIITSIEPDHLDHYGSVGALHEAFADFARSCSVLVAHGDDPVVAGIAAAAAESGVRVLMYGAGEGLDAQVTPDAVVAEGMSFPLSLPLPGAHNRLNAAAAWTAAVQMGADPTRAAAALGEFSGTGRRFQLRGEAAGVRVIDDYAHHPTEVAAVIAAARAAGAGHLVVLFQPALFTRTRDLHAGFAAALSVANADIVLAPVHGDREDPIDGVDSELIARDVAGSVVVAESLEAAARLAAERAREGSTVLTVGSGTVTRAPDWILAELGAR